MFFDGRSYTGGKDGCSENQRAAHCLWRRGAVAGGVCSGAWSAVDRCSSRDAGDHFCIGDSCGAEVGGAEFDGYHCGPGFAPDGVGRLDDPSAEWTLFAPINYAFDQLPDGTVEALLADPAGDLTQILLYHVVDESLDADQLVADGSATTLQGADVEVTSRTLRLWGWRFPYSIVSVNGNRVIAADITTPG